MVGRKNELKYLQQQFEQEGNQLLVLYGRSGIGKDELLQTFCEDKKHLYYSARQASPKLQRQLLGLEIQEKYGMQLPDFTYDTFFNRIRSGDASKLVLVIEGFEKIAKKDPEFMESIVKLKSRRLYPGPVLIILCSSSIAWVENDMVQCIGNIAKKITGIYKVKELDFVDIVHRFPKSSVAECIQLYGVFGGIPAYLSHVDENKDIRANICKTILRPGAPLYEEAERYIGAQLRELSVYDTILEAVASGRMKLNDIYKYTEYSRAKISVYLKNLMEFEVVEKVYSFESGGWQNAQKGLYQVKNTFINFWFKFVYPHLSDLHTMDPEEFYEKHIEEGLEEYLEHYFVQVCMEYLQLMSMVRQLPIQIHKIGTWIGKQGRIDIVAQNSVRENIVALCNWSEPELTYEMYEQLLKSMAMARINANNCFLFSAKAFDSAITKAAKENQELVLIDMTRL